MYYNPRIYNYSNLKDEDKKVVDYLLLMSERMEDLEDAENMDADFSDTTYEKIQHEIRAGAYNDAVDEIIMFIIEIMVSMIENYDEDVEELDTHDFFVGCPYKEDYIDDDNDYED